MLQWSLSLPRAKDGGRLRQHGGVSCGDVRCEHLVVLKMRLKSRGATKERLLDLSSSLATIGSKHSKLWLKKSDDTLMNFPDTKWSKWEEKEWEWR